MSGDFATYSNYAHSGRLSALLVEVGGDFYQQGVAYSFDSTGGFTVRFTGGGQHKAYFADTATSGFAYVATDSDSCVLEEGGRMDGLKMAGCVARGMRDGLAEYLLGNPAAVAVVLAAWG